MILRVFPRRTNATPDDEYARIGRPDMLDPPPGISEVHISVTFTWDIQEGRTLYDLWAQKCDFPVRLGGPAFGDRGSEFVPGRYLKAGNIITSRGCPQACWFCSVPTREGRAIRELRIKDGWKVQDSNLLACSREHIEGVLTMLDRQEKRAVFAGGLEAARLEPWMAKGMREIGADRLYFAFDTPDDEEPLKRAGELLTECGFTRAHHLYAYVLIGYPGDTKRKAWARLRTVWAYGFCPYAMLFRNQRGRVEKEWRAFQRLWVRPAIIRRRCINSATV
jgi:hypothetical protein